MLINRNPVELMFSLLLYQKLPSEPSFPVGKAKNVWSPSSLSYHWEGPYYGSSRRKKHFLMDDAFLKTMEASFLCCHVYIEDGLKRGPQVKYYILLLLYRFLERLELRVFRTSSNWNLFHNGSNGLNSKTLGFKFNVKIQICFGF